MGHMSWDRHKKEGNYHIQGVVHIGKSQWTSPVNVIQFKVMF